MKILIYCPTYRRADGNLAIFPDTQACIDNLDYGAHRVTVEISASLTEDKQNNVIRQYQRARQMTLDGGYDAVLFIEHDMIIPPDALVKMAEAQGDVVYGVYMFRHGKPTMNAFRETSGVGLDCSLQNYPQELQRAIQAQVWPVSGLGFGCTLIHRRVFDQVEIRMPENGHYPDGPFAADAKRLGYKQVAHFGVLCGHIRPDGYVLWPLMDGKDVAMDMIKVKILRSFNGNVRGLSVPFSAGQEAQIPMEEAIDFQRAGLLAIVDSAPQVKIVNRPTRILKAAVK